MANYLFENREGKNINLARKYCMNRGYNQEQAQRVIDDIRHDIPNSRLAGNKFLLGITRMDLDDELTDAETIMSINRTLQYVANDAYVDKYNNNLNDLSASDIISRFSDIISADVAREKEQSINRRYSQNNDYNIIKVPDFETANQYSGYVTWCVTQDKKAYNSYTNDGLGVFYFCLKNGFENVPRTPGKDAPLDEYGLSMIAVSVNEDGSPNTITCRWNHDEGGNDHIMATQQLEQIIGRSFYTTFLPYSETEVKEKEAKKQAIIREAVESFREKYCGRKTITYWDISDGYLVPLFNVKDDLEFKHKHYFAYLYRSDDMEDSKYIIISNDGELLINDLYDYVWYIERSGIVLLDKVPNKTFVSLIDNNLKYVSDKWYSDITNTCTNLYLRVRNNEGLYNLVYTINGNEVFENWVKSCEVYENRAQNGLSYYSIISTQEGDNIVPLYEGSHLNPLFNQWKSNIHVVDNVYITVLDKQQHGDKRGGNGRFLKIFGPPYEIYALNLEKFPYTVNYCYPKYGNYLAFCDEVGEYGGYVYFKPDTSNGFEILQIVSLENPQTDGTQKIVTEKKKTIVSPNYLFENREGKNINLARKYCMDYGFSLEQANSVIDGIRHDIPNSRLAGNKFLLGITRMDLDDELTDAETIMSINKTLSYVANDAYVDKYNNNLNDLSASDIISRFSDIISADVAREKEQSINRGYSQNNDYNIIKVPDFDTASQYSGYVTWCITQNKGSYNSYTHNGLGLFYFCLKNGFENVPRTPGKDAPLDEYGLSMIAVSVNEDGSPNTITCRWNHDEGGNDQIMTTQQLEQIIGRSFFTTFLPYSETEKEEKKQAIIRGAVESFRERYCGRNTIKDWEIGIGYLKPLFNVKDDPELKNKHYFSYWYISDDMERAKYIIISNDGELLINDLYDEVEYDSITGTVRLTKGHNKTCVSLIDNNLKYLTNKWYKDVKNTFTDLYLIVKNNAGLYNIVYTINGNEVFENWVKWCRVYENGSQNGFSHFSIIQDQEGYDIIPLDKEFHLNPLFNKEKFDIDVIDRCFIKVVDKQQQINGQFEIYAFNLEKFPYTVYSIDGYFNGYWRVTCEVGYVFFRPGTVDGFKIENIVPFEKPQADVTQKIVTEKKKPRKTVIINEDIMSNYLIENREGKNINLARKYCMGRGFSLEQANRVIDGIRHDIPNSRLAVHKFLLGITRMYLDKQLTDADTIMSINKTLQYVANDAYADKYNNNLNDLSAGDIISRFSDIISTDVAREREQSINREYSQNNDYSIIKVPDFETANQYSGYVSWCVTQDKSYYDNYTSNGLGLFYFCLKNGFENVPRTPGKGAPLDEYGLSMIAVSVNEDGSPNTITCRWNHDEGGNDQIMTTQQLEQIIGRSFFTTFLPYSETEKEAKEQAIIKNAVESFRERYCGRNTIKDQDIDNVYLIPLFDVMDDPELKNKHYFAYRYRSGDIECAKYIIISNDGELLINDLCDEVEYYSAYGMVFLTKGANMTCVSLIDNNLKYVSNKWYSYITDTCTNLYLRVRNNEGLYNLVYTINGNEVFENWVEECFVYENRAQNGFSYFCIIKDQEGYDIIPLDKESHLNPLFNKEKFDIDVIDWEFIKVVDKQQHRDSINGQSFEIYALNLEKFPYTVYSFDGYFNGYYRVTCEAGYVYFWSNTFSGFKRVRIVPFETPQADGTQKIVTENKKTVIINEDIMTHYLIENREGKNINLARKYCISRGYNQEQAQRVIDDIRHDIPNSRLAVYKFLLGITRMYLDKQLTDAETIMSINKTLQYVANDAYADKYNNNLNDLSAGDIISKFSDIISADVAREKEQSINRRYSQNNDYSIIKVPDFDTASQYSGYVTWCITQNKGSYNSYTHNGLGLFYFCLKNGFENVRPIPGNDAPLDEYGLSMIAVSVNEDGSPNTITCRWNHDEGGNDQIMTTQQLEQIIGRSFYTTFLPYSETEKEEKKQAKEQAIIRGAVESFREKYCGRNTIKSQDIDNVYLIPLFDVEDDPELKNKHYFAYRNRSDGMGSSKYIIISNDGELLINEVYDSVIYNRGMVFLTKGHNKTCVSLIDNNLKYLTDKRYSYIIYTCTNLYLKVKNYEGLCNLVYTINGNEVFENWVKSCEVYENRAQNGLSYYSIISTQEGYNIIPLDKESHLNPLFNQWKFEIQVVNNVYIKVVDKQQQGDSANGRFGKLFGEAYEIYTLNLENFPYTVNHCSLTGGNYLAFCDEVGGCVLFSPNTSNGFEILQIISLEEPQADGTQKIVTENKKTVIINEDMANNINDLLTMTQFKFKVNIRKFLAELLEDPIGSKPGAIFVHNGLDKNKLIKALVDNKVITKKMTIDDHDKNGNPHTAKMIVKYSVPKVRFNERLDALYDVLFPNVEVKINEASSCSGVDGSGFGSGEVIVPFGGISVRKKKKKKPKKEIGGNPYTMAECKRLVRGLINEAVTGKDTEKAVAIYAYCLDDKEDEYCILCSKRLNGDEKGKWNPPMGHLHDGESPKDGAVRECEEESGVKIPKSKLHVGSYEDWGRNYFVILDGTIKDWPIGKGDGENSKFEWKNVYSLFRGKDKYLEWAWDTKDFVYKFSPTKLDLDESACNKVNIW